MKTQSARSIGIVFLVLARISIAHSADESKEDPKPTTQVKYKSGKAVDFEELLIQGRLKRPEVTVVTGDSGNGTDGLLRLRESFIDRMSVDMGEAVQ